MLLALPIESVTKVLHEKICQMTPFLDPLGLEQFFEIAPSITPRNADCYDISITLLV